MARGLTYPSKRTRRGSRPPRTMCLSEDINRASSPQEPGRSDLRHLLTPARRVKPPQHSPLGSTTTFSLMVLGTPLEGHPSHSTYRMTGRRLPRFQSQSPNLSSLVPLPKSPSGWVYPAATRPGTHSKDSAWPRNLPRQLLRRRGRQGLDSHFLLKRLLLQGDSPPNLLPHLNFQVFLDPSPKMPQ